MDFSALSITKMAVSFIVGAGTKTIVTEVIKSHVAEPENVYAKVKFTAATVVLSAVVAKAAKKHTNDMIDDVATFVSKTFQAMQDGDDILGDLLHKEEATVTIDPEDKKTNDVIIDEPANGAAV